MLLLNEIKMVNKIKNIKTYLRAAIVALALGTAVLGVNKFNKFLDQQKYNSLALKEKTKVDSLLKEGKINKDIIKENVNLMSRVINDLQWMDRGIALIEEDETEKGIGKSGSARLISLITMLEHIKYDVGLINPRIFDTKNLYARIGQFEKALRELEN